MDPRVEPLKQELRGIISSGRLDGLPAKDSQNAEFVKQKIIAFIAKLDTYEARKKDEPIAIVESANNDKQTPISTPIPDLQSTNRSSASNQSEAVNETSNPNTSSESVESIKSSASSLAAAKDVLDDLRAGKKRKLSKYGENDLQLAAKKGNFELVKSLLELQDVNHKDNNGNTPLHDAIAHNHFKIVEVLLEHEDIEIDVQDCDGNTPLHYSTREENKKIIELLLENDANPIIRNKQGELPGDLAINPKIIRTLQKAVDEKNERLSQRSVLNVSRSSCMIKEKPLFEGEALCFIHSSMNDGKKITKKQLAEYDANNPNVKFTSDLNKATHVICTKELIGIDPESPTYTEGFGIFLQAMYQGKLMVNDSFLETQDSTSSILELFDESPLRVLELVRSKSLPFMSGFKVYFADQPTKKIVPSVQSILGLESVGAKILKRRPRPDDDAIQADREIIQSQADFQYTHLIVYHKKISNPVKRGKVCTVHVNWLLRTLLYAKIFNVE